MGTTKGDGALSESEVGHQEAAPKHRHGKANVHPVGQSKSGTQNGSNGVEWKLVPRLVEILISGAFVLGVTTVAGAIWFAGQLRGVGLTGSDAIGALPRSELLAEGADQLIPYALVAAGLITAFVAVQRWVAQHWTDPRRGVMGFVLTKANVVALTASFVVLFGGLAALGFGRRPERWTLAWFVPVLFVLGGAACILILPGWSSGGITTEDSRSGLARVVRRMVRAGRVNHEEDVPGLVAGCIVLVGGVVLLFLSAGPPTGRGALGWFGTLAILGLGAAIIIMLARRADQSSTPGIDLWVPIAIGVTTLLFGMAVGYPSGFGVPRVRPGAVVLAEHNVVTGAWIGATSQSVYLGEICWRHPSRDAPVVVIPRGRVRSYAYGRLEDPRKAYGHLLPTATQALLLAPTSRNTSEALARQALNSSATLDPACAKGGF